MKELSEAQMEEWLDKMGYNDSVICFEEWVEDMIDIIYVFPDGTWCERNADMVVYLMGNNYAVVEVLRGELPQDAAARYTNSRRKE